MKRPNQLIGLLILFFISWALLFTIADYVTCQNTAPDEFLDIAAFGCQRDNSSILELRGIIYVENCQGDMRAERVAEEGLRLSVSLPIKRSPQP